MPAGFGPEASQKIETIPTTNDMSRADKERWANCAAVYVRMSTEHQQYSTSNQMDIIREYAKQRGFTIVKVYSDEGKSGLNIQGRDSLAQMIRDVQEGKAEYTFILVYDVSRWGRFQDADESAYYEYICRRAGVLERNIRRYLGLQGNRVNEAISKTLGVATEAPNFYFYNNGITMVCRRFSHNALQQGDFQVKVEGLQVINGGQTCVTIQKALASSLAGQLSVEKSFALVRIYELADEDVDLMRNITFATNSQNPVDLRDLRSNDLAQRQLENAIGLLGYNYRRHRSEASFQATDISTATAAEAVLSVWRNRPHQAKYQSREHFGKLYGIIFSPDLNGAQVVIATLLFRIAENKRKRPPTGAPAFLSYGSGFLAMLMGKYLLADLGIPIGELNHLKFAAAKQMVEERSEAYFPKAVTAVEAALKRIYGEQEISWQRLAATFRRGDLIQELDYQPVLPQVPTANGNSNAH
jgi:hypothetical protein